MIESLFGYNINYSLRNDEAKSPSPRKHILEPKRLQNITILSKALNVTSDHICEALLQGNFLFIYLVITRSISTQGIFIPLILKKPNTPPKTFRKIDDTLK